MAAWETKEFGVEDSWTQICCLKKSWNQVVDIRLVTETTCFLETDSNLKLRYNRTEHFKKDCYEYYYTYQIKIQRRTTFPKYQGKMTETFVGALVLSK
ncbi:unnamed protein product [Dovyalis caffra]|uniref:F-box associated domain-containing protein n=1 Tax=Dovyalis caffra TaxID=77055 RepID=A0AAV1RWR5_9ROSI|nr:unnamed protein product [Dovyalis caffra]